MVVKDEVEEILDGLINRWVARRMAKGMGQVIMNKGRKTQGFLGTVNGQI